MNGMLTLTEGMLMSAEDQNMLMSAESKQRPHTVNRNIAGLVLELRIGQSAAAKDNREKRFLKFAAKPKIRIGIIYYDYSDIYV